MVMNMTRKEKAEKNFYEGYTCSQSVVKAFSDLIEIDEKTLLKIALPLGGGLGRLRLTCGAVNGIAIIIGLIFGSSEIDDNNKSLVYSMVQEVASRFEEHMGTLNCKKLLEKAEVEVTSKGKPDVRTEDYYRKRPCGKIVYEAARVLEEFLVEKEIIKEN